MISPATVEQVRAASDIVDVIGGYIPLKRAGANFVALCPFHKEKSPSFNVSPHRQFFHCFGCHKGGDVFTFVREYENIDFVDAVRRLAERARIPIETDGPSARPEARHIKDQLLLIHEQITQRWQAALANDASGQIARDYLAKRGVPAEAVQLFRLGYAPDAWDDTVNWAKSKHFEPAVVEQSGLILRKEGADHYYDRFRGRLIFPICDEQGRVIGFSGRVLSGDEKTAKYVNSPESPVFTKGKVMFGLDKSKRAILDARCAVVCEGQLDLIACFMAGVKNIVAPQGTALTSDHARVLKRHADEVVLCFDSDNAGQNAAVRSLDSLLAAGLAVRVASIPAPHDPDSYIKQFGGPAFSQIVQNAQGFFDYYLDRLCAANELSGDRGRRAVVQAMSEAVHKTGSAVLQDTYAQKTALRLGVPAAAVRDEFKKISRAPLPGDEERPEAAAPDISRPSRQESGFLRLLLENDALVEWVAAHLDLEWIAHPAARDIAAWRLRMEENKSWPGLAAWLSETDNALWRNLITETLVDKRPLPNPESEMKGSPTRAGAVKNLRDSHIDRQLAALNQRLESPDLNDAGTLDLLREKSRLNQLKQQPLAPRNVPAS
ncbi:MAG: DNA primase [Verrucomicrobiota bacterium]|jgi:DNA primase